MLKFLKRTGIFLVACLAIICIVLFYLSPGKASPIRDNDGVERPGSISVIESPVIGGIQQSLIIRGENVNNPVLLFVHGGPGMPTFPYIKEQFKGMEKLFTICYWDQRGAGKSYTSDIPLESMTLSQLIEDGIDVTRYLTKRLGKQKIYILGHSWGTFLASFMINKRPELYYAYLGVGQAADTYLSEQRSYEFVLSKAQSLNDQDVLAQMKKLKLPSSKASSQEWHDYLWIERQQVFSYGGARYGVDRKITDLVKPMILCREYTLRNKINYKTGLDFSMQHLWNAMIGNDLNKVLPEQYIPVYIFQGVHDHQTDYSVAKDYFELLKAPVKKFYAFEQSAHSPHVEEYDAFEKIIRTEVLLK